MNICCSRCQKKLEVPGGLFFTSPFESQDGMGVVKYHLCLKCSVDCENWIHSK